MNKTLLKEDLHKQYLKMKKIHGKDKYKQEAIAEAVDLEPGTIRSCFSTASDYIPAYESMKRICDYIHYDFNKVIESGVYDKDLRVVYADNLSPRPLNETEKIELFSEMSGLSLEAINRLIKLKEDRRSQYLSGLSLLLTDDSNIIGHVLTCLSAFRTNEDITIDILPEGVTETDLFINDFDGLTQAQDQQIDFESCSLTEYKDKGILATTKRGARITINNDFGLTKDLIRQARLNKLTAALLNLADQIDKDSYLFKKKNSN